MAEITRERCSVMVSGSGQWGAFHQSRCQRAATITAGDGKPYCGIHAPGYIAAKRAREEARWAEERARKQSMIDQKNLALSIIRGFDMDFLRANIAKIRFAIGEIEKEGN